MSRLFGKLTAQDYQGFPMSAPDTTDTPSTDTAHQRPTTHFGFKQVEYQPKSEYGERSVSVGSSEVRHYE